MDKTFPHSYTCEELTEIRDPSSTHYYYPGGSTSGGHDGLLVEVRLTTGQTWVGSFAFGQVSQKSFSGVFTTPNPDRLCVVAKGQGYIVSSQHPESWIRVDASPIMDVRPIASKGIIIFADYTRISAYGELGIIWRTQDISWDGLEITEITDHVIRGVFWDAPNQKNGTFIVDLSTGEVQAGKSKGAGPDPANAPK